MLHAHLPFVRHPEHEQFLEENWLYEALTECYLPLLGVFERLVDDGVPFRITMVLTPSLLSMLEDKLLKERYLKHVEELVSLAQREVRRTARNSSMQRLAKFYVERFVQARDRFASSYNGDLISAFRALESAGALELITSAATHAYLPLLQPYPLAVAAQIRTALACHKRLLGRCPSGIWLPECGYYQGLDGILCSHGLRYFFTDTHGLLYANPRPAFGVYAPILPRPGLAVFGRDRKSSMQVWSSKVGYPGDTEYRDFYRDIGFDLDSSYLENQLQPTGERKSTGIKYHRITGRTQQKKIYRPERAALRAESHAEHFMTEREAQIAELAEMMPAPIVVSPYDAELFGHWWFEGPLFLDAFIRRAASRQAVFKMVTPGEYLRLHPFQLQSTPAPSSWGRGGYNEMWLNESNDWIYKHIHWASERMISLAERFKTPGPLERRILNQAARELMLGQASDWAFIMKTGTMVPYARRRTIEHLDAFRRLYLQLDSGRPNSSLVESLEKRHNIFPEMDYRCFQEDYCFPRLSEACRGRP